MRPVIIAASLAALAWAAFAIYRIAPSVDSDFPSPSYRGKPDINRLSDYIHNRSVV